MSPSRCRSSNMARAAGPRCRRSSPTNSAPTGARSRSNPRRCRRSTAIRWRGGRCSRAGSTARSSPERVALMATVGSSSIRQFGGPLGRSRRGRAGVAVQGGGGANRRAVAAMHDGARVRDRGQDPAALRRSGGRGGDAESRPAWPRAAPTNRGACSASRCPGSTRPPRSTARPISRATSACPAWCSPRCARRRRGSTGPDLGRSRRRRPRSPARARSSPTTAGSRRSPTPGGRRARRSTPPQPRFRGGAGTDSARHRAALAKALDGPGTRMARGGRPGGAVQGRAGLHRRLSPSASASMPRWRPPAPPRASPMAGSNCGCRPKPLAPHAPRPPRRSASARMHVDTPQRHGRRRIRRAAGKSRSPNRPRCWRASSAARSS